MARPKKANEPAKQFDVSRPGSAKPSASSRPIIVSSGPIMQDPMVKKDDSSSKPGAPVVETSGTRLSKLMQPSKARVTITPPNQASPQVKPDEVLTNEKEAEGKSLDELAAKAGAKKTASTIKAKIDNDENSTSIAVTVNKSKKSQEPTKDTDNQESHTSPDEQKQEAPNDDNSISPISPELTDEEKNQPDKEEEKPAQTDKKVKSDEENPKAGDESSVVNAVAGQAADKKSKQLTKEEQVYQDKISELIASRQYNVPIGHLRRRRHVRNFLVVAMIVIFILAVSANFAMDAQVITVDGIQPLTNLL